MKNQPSGEPFEEGEEYEIEIAEDIDEDEEGEENETFEDFSTGSGVFLYLVWFALFFFLTSLIFGFGIASLLHGAGVLFGFICGEPLFRFLNGWREIRTNREKEKLLPILDSVVVLSKPYMKNAKKIEIFISEDLAINAAALGSSSVMITKGALLQLGEEQITALFLHEFGHIANHDSAVSLTFECFNWPWMIIFKIIDRVTVKVDNSKFWYGSSPVTFMWAPFKWLSIILQNLTSVILAYSKRKQEYGADEFAFICGCGEGLIALLYDLDMLGNTEPRKVRQYLMATHPPLTKRIQNLEECVKNPDEVKNKFCRQDQDH